MATKKCAVPDCGVRTPVSMLMCKPHWVQVPMKLRREVSRTWRLFNANPSESRWREYIGARKDAIESVMAANMVAGEEAESGADVRGDILPVSSGITELPLPAATVET